ncbi:histidinol-phosphatase [Parabacteroides sp. OttesenSCG-928-N08]|nr:histidinol-phosphatase [Parabacteroides sp. OttesenSCG-928-N08]
MQLSNYHSHTTFCDGRSAPEDFVKFALSNRFHTYGFSAHSPLPFETFWNMSPSDLPEYLQEIQRLKEKYADKITLYTGMEIDYLDESYNASIPYFREMPLDYRIASIHYLPASDRLSIDNVACVDGPLEEFREAMNGFFGGDIRRFVVRYYESVMRMIQAGGFDIVGHIDKIFQNGQFIEGFDMDAGWYKELLRACLEEAAKQGLMVEINTKNLNNKRETFPNQRFLPWLFELKIPVMVNSDCHYPHLVNDGREEAFELLKQAGFTSTRELINGVWSDVNI